MFISGILFSLPLLAVPDASDWREPRNFHEPFDTEFSNRVGIRKIKTTEPKSENAVLSTNGSYWFSVTPPEKKNQEIIISADTSAYRIAIKDSYPNFPIQARWINEKLLFIRVYWGRIVGSDYILDVELGSFIYKEMVHDGTLLFQQTNQAKK